MFYKINKKQKEIIKNAVEKNNHIRSLHDLKFTEFYEPLINSHDPYIRQSAVNREIVYLKCTAENKEQFSEFWKSDEYKSFISWGAGELELHAMGLYLDMKNLKNLEMERLFIFIHHLARIAREKVERPPGDESGPGSEGEFMAALEAAKLFLDNKP